VCFTHLYSLIDMLSISTSFFLDMNFYDAMYRLLCAPWTKCPRFALHYWRKDDPVTDDVVPSDFSLEEKPREITGSSNGNWAKHQKTHRYSSQLQCFLLQRIQRNRALAVRQIDVVNVEKMSRKIKPWIRRYRCVSGLLCRFLRSTLLRICCEGERGKLR
jgi:hypothetical protein